MGNRLEGKVVVVTGGTQGIGKGVALMCAAVGAKVVVNGRHEQNGTAVVREIQDKHGQAALFVKADISSEEECKRLMDETIRQFGRVDGLVNMRGFFPVEPWSIPPKTYSTLFLQ
ncbi:SDR family NAD(P)-dependent oxidoreductase [Alicyclobacillus fastidiosus]|uniref:SDR family NAD(P)-dependent oxidoreductase n=1 Tax=Alicyclobacillus fastidiosus TaxID=392011 RepID=A0ABY6ZC97_9BACL|nr:SDR family NAD(P)-dependent oxidoreductase [Alicyclobacillus fastidiosus]WAH39746.1 SDR family NAD(P)-dependent oxidoreductase [Alicyclobacillus fastidiosus]GMA60981.1 hypothetical protein GCM10025859_14210 [Alicyclobacillus fastidiosus]